MSEEKGKVTQVVSFLSGRGGVGKTTAAISMAHLLNDAGLRVLLVDLDFATNGASYFYKHAYAGRPAEGLYEAISREWLQSKKLPLPASVALFEVKEGLHFIPSRTNFSKKLPLRDSITIDEHNLRGFVRSLLTMHYENTDVILIDNQAGSNLTARVAAEVSDKVVIVSELDPICNDTVDTLLIQIGDAFPEYRRHLINKLDIREAESYRDLSLIFQSLNRLPPLPYDLEVKNAVASRRVPVDVSEPSTFLIALFNTTRAFLPEYADKLGGSEARMLERLGRYEEEVSALLDKKRELQKKLDRAGAVERKKAEILRVMVMLIAYSSFVLLGFGCYFGVRRSWDSEAIPLVVTGAVLLMLVVAVETYVGGPQGAEVVVPREQLLSEMSKIDNEISRYKSFTLTREREFLLRFGAAGKRADR